MLSFTARCWIHKHTRRFTNLYFGADWTSLSCLMMYSLLTAALVGCVSYHFLFCITPIKLCNRLFGCVIFNFYGAISCWDFACNCWISFLKCPTILRISSLSSPTPVFILMGSKAKCQSFPLLYCQQKVIFPECQNHSLKYYPLYTVSCTYSRIKNN